MKQFRTSILKTITALALVIAMGAGTVVSLGGKAQAATAINIAYAAGDAATINGGPVYNVTAYANVATTITSVKPSRSGCNFLGWTRDKNSGRIDFKPGDPATFAKGTTLWPVWNTNICYAAGEGKFSNGSPNINVGVTLGKATTVLSSKPSRSGYAFLGWTTTKGSNSIFCRPGETITFTGPLTLWPVWKAAQSIGVTFNTTVATKVSGPTYQSCYSGISFTLNAPSVSRDGCSFREWNTKKDGTGTKYKAGQTVTLTSSLTLYAIFNATITYNVNKGTTSSTKKTQTVVAGVATKLAPPTITRADCELLGFSTSQYDSTAKYKDTDSVTITGNTTLYAIWKALPGKLPDGASVVGQLSYKEFVPAREGGGSTRRYGAYQHYSGYFDEDLVTTVFNGFHKRVTGLDAVFLRNWCDGTGINPNGVNVENYIQNFTKDKARYLIKNNSCGAFAAVNTYLYLAKYRGNSVTDGLVKQEIKDFYSREVKTLGGVGSYIFTDGNYYGTMADYIESKNCDNKGYAASWNQSSTASSVYNDFNRMLNNDIPIMMAYDSNKTLPCYRLSSDGSYLVSNGGFTSHYFVVTAYFYYKNEYWCMISSAGECEFFKINDWLNKRLDPKYSGYMNVWRCS